MFEKLTKKHFEILTLHHAKAILQHDMPQAAGEIEAVLSGLSIPAKELVEGGGGESKVTQRLRRSLSDDYGWKKHNFEIKKIIDGDVKESTSHEIDHVKKFGDATFALEIEWNNKDPFFDRDLENFKRLHADGAISVGCIITRGSTLHASMRETIEKFAVKESVNSVQKVQSYYDITKKQIAAVEKAVKNGEPFTHAWASRFVSSKYGEATTHWRKLEERVERGVGNPCPLLLIGIPKDVVIL